MNNIIDEQAKTIKAPAEVPLFPLAPKRENRFIVCELMIN